MSDANKAIEITPKTHGNTYGAHASHPLYLWIEPIRNKTHFKEVSTGMEIMPSQVGCSAVVVDTYLAP